MRTMPCAAGELCTILGLTPELANGHACWKALMRGATALRGIVLQLCPSREGSGGGRQ